jgi:hypothetical protein
MSPELTGSEAERAAVVGINTYPRRKRVNMTSDRPPKAEKMNRFSEKGDKCSKHTLSTLFYLRKLIPGTTRQKVTARGLSVKKMCLNIEDR